MCIKENRKNKLKCYVRLNWGAPFIIAFMVLLVSAAFSVLFGISSLTDILAVNGFYTLTVGVIMQLFCILRYKKNEQTEVA
jgi:hypothetical protein